MPGRTFSILDGHRANLHSSVINDVRKFSIQLLSPAAHFNHKLQIGQQFFPHLKCLLSGDNNRSKNPARVFGKLQFRKLYIRSLNKNFNPKIFSSLIIICGYLPL
jgi:hypothetical protein